MAGVTGAEEETAAAMEAAMAEVKWLRYPQRLRRPGYRLLRGRGCRQALSTCRSLC